MYTLKQVTSNEQNKANKKGEESSVAGIAAQLGPNSYISRIAPFIYVESGFPRLLLDLHPGLRTSDSGDTVLFMSLITDIEWV